MAFAGGHGGAAVAGGCGGIFGLVVGGGVLERGVVGRHLLSRRGGRLGWGLGIVG